MEQESKQALIEAKNTDSIAVAFKANAKRKSLGRAIFPYLLILPTLALITLFTFIPTINSAIQSTVKPPRTVQQEAEFVGLKNYLDLFDNNTVIGQEDNFQRVFVNTLVFVAVTVPVCVILAFLLALLLNQKLKLTSIYRTGIFYPVLLPLLSAASIWAFSLRTVSVC